MKTEPILLFYLLVASFVVGFFLGFLRDTLHFIGRFLSKLCCGAQTVKRHAYSFVRFLQDILFCTIVGSALVVILFYYSEGKLRVFSTIALVIGAAIYRQSVGRLFLRFAEYLSKKLAYAVSWICGRFTTPIVRLCGWIFRRMATPVRAYHRKLKDRRLQKYSTMRIEVLRKISKAGFVNM